MASWRIDSCVRGFHVYQDIWTPVLHEELDCERERGNIEDLYAVAVKKNGHVVGHIPRKISAICSTFIRRGGCIICTVTGSRRYSRDLVQGGLEIPCITTFITDSEIEVNKSNEDYIDADTVQTEVDDSGNENTVWIEYDAIRLVLDDRSTILSGGYLNDKHIYFGQNLLRRRFPEINGLKSRLEITKPSYKFEMSDSLIIQVIHCKDNHWITASNVGCQESKITVYDSLYKAIDQRTYEMLSRLFSIKTFTIKQPQKQTNGYDCGLFALAFATTLAYEKK
uniref:Ubiquitin-like protease family profile domain-containing protein n=1 Tax=Amphimedon queenslandica TaxID=400682 RepID=A0A1X7TG99_AMPQE